MQHTIAGLLTGSLLALTLGVTAAQATPTGLGIDVQQVGPRALLDVDSHGDGTVTSRVRFSCPRAARGVSVLVELIIRQDDNPGGYYAEAYERLDCTGRRQSVTLTANQYGTPLVPGRAIGTATIYGCPDGSNEYCGGLIGSRENTRLRLVERSFR